MPALRRFELDDLLNRPGSYYNPDTGILLVIDDSAAVDADIFEEESGDAEWVLLADDVPVDEQARDELIERFEVRHHGGASGAVPADEDDEDVLDDELEADDEVDEL
jgi:GT2 family glycosyltransferase